MSNGHGRSTDGFGINRQQSVELIVQTALQNGVNDPRQIAYMLATAQHETRNFTAPDEDFGRSQARKLGYSGGENYFGRGYVHLTHDYNYKKFDELLGLDGELVRNPQLAKDPEIAAKILVVGMRDGLFTGKEIGRYIDHDTHDTYNARRTVNGIIPSKAWSVTAAKDCQRYAEAWERLVPGLIEKVQRDGVDLTQGTSPGRGNSGAGATPAVLKEGMEGQAVRDLQTQLAALGYTGKDGKPLNPDGDFGANTKHAVEAFQKVHGLDVDGKAGKLTLAEITSAKANPLVSEASHPSHALYAAIGKQLPAAICREAVANITLQAMENGIAKPADLQAVLLRDGDVHVRGNVPGFNVRVDINAPTADLQAMSDHMASQSRQAAQQRSQDPVLQ